MNLRAIRPADLGAEWERVRAGLLEVKKATPDDWLPEDIYMALRQGQAVLYVAEDGGAYLGFVVLRLVQAFHASEMHIWCAHSATRRPLMRLVLPQLQAIARQAGAARLTFSSARPEWAAAATRLGFKPAQVSYSLSLSEAS